jgi:WD40 repeat protein
MSMTTSKLMRHSLLSLPFFVFVNAAHAQLVPDSNSCLFIPNQTGIFHSVADLKDGDSEILLDDPSAIPSVKNKAVVHLNKRYVNQIASNRDGTKLAASENGGVRTWDIGPRGTLRNEKLKDLKTNCEGLAFSADGRNIVVGTQDGEVFILASDLTSSQKVTAYKKDFMVDSVCFIRGDVFAVATSHAETEQTVKLFDLKGNAFDSFPAVGLVRSLAANPDLPPEEQFVVVGCVKGQVQRWDVQARKTRWTHTTAADRTTVGVSPTDGKTVAEGHDSGEVLFLDSKDGTKKTSGGGHAGMNCLRYSPDSSQTVSCGGKDIDARTTPASK